jgi:hypothetical protein
MSPAQRSLRKLRAEGWLVALAERWNPHAKVRQDLFGFANLIAIKGTETLAVQTTTGSNLTHRLEKIRSSPSATQWLVSPHRQIAIHGWRKIGRRGRRKTWQCRDILLNGAQSEGKQP